MSEDKNAVPSQMEGTALLFGLTTCSREHVSKIPKGGGEKMSR